MKQFFLVCLLTSIGMMLGCNARVAGPPVAPAKPAPKIGDPAPEIVGSDLDGQEFKLSDYRGKVVLLKFYGDW